MFSFIIRNIFVILPIAVFIGLRIVEARRRYQNARNSPLPETKPSGVFVDDDDYEPVGPNPGGFVWREVTPPPAPVAKPPVRYIAPLADSILSLPLHIKEEHLAAVQAPARPIQAPVPAQPQGRDFSERINRLTMLQRAVVMAEIIGPPKGEA